MSHHACNICKSPVKVHEKIDDLNTYVFNSDGELIKDQSITGKPRGYTEYTCTNDESHDIDESVTAALDDLISDL